MKNESNFNLLVQYVDQRLNEVEKQKIEKLIFIDETDQMLNTLNQLLQLKRALGKDSSIHQYLNNKFEVSRRKILEVQESPS